MLTEPSVKGRFGVASYRGANKSVSCYPWLTMSLTPSPAERLVQKNIGKHNNEMS